MTQIIDGVKAEYVVEFLDYNRPNIIIDIREDMDTLPTKGDIIGLQRGSYIVENVKEVNLAKITHRVLVTQVYEQ